MMAMLETDFFQQTSKVYSVAELTRQIRGTLETRFGAVWVQGEISNYRLQPSGHRYFTLKDQRAAISCVVFRNTLAPTAPPIVDGAQVQLYGIVTSPSGAAIRDVLNVLQRRAPNVYVLINPVRVQGIGAAAEIATAIKELATPNHAWEPLDLIVIARGGGSIEDLWEFNEEIVARAIFHSALPVVSAVGHEIDFTIADFVADLRAPTPSAAAELIVPDAGELSRRVTDL